MTVFWSILLSLLALKLVLTASIRTHPPTMSAFELARRSSEPITKLQSRRLHSNILVQSMITLVTQLYLVIILFCSYGAFGLLWSILIGVSLLLLHARIAHIPLIHRIAQRYYDRHEEKILHFIEKHPRIFKLIRNQSTDDSEFNLQSKEELCELVKHSKDVLKTDEKNLILRTLDADKKNIRAIMTPRTMISAVSVHETLGPQVLDELYKTGHTCFPVYDETIDHIKGILYLGDLLHVKNDSLPADQAMQEKVCYILETQTPEQALAAFLKTQHRLFVVINELRETVGILTLKETVESLFGQKIIDEFDAHDDIRTVASRNIQVSPTTKNHRDL